MFAFLTSNFQSTPLFGNNGLHMCDGKAQSKAPIGPMYTQVEKQRRTERFSSAISNSKNLSF